MLSMTGYGKGVAEKDGLKVTVEFKSVNHRFLDIAFKLPRCYQFAEKIIRDALSASVSRGHVDVFMNVEDGRESGRAVLNEKLAADYKKIAVRLTELGFADDVTASVLLRVPDMVESSEPDEGDEVLKEIVASAAVAAAKALREMRLTEGKRLEKDIECKVAAIKKLLDEIALRAPEVVSEHREKLRERVSDAFADVQIDENRLLGEVAIYADRVAIDEEITRLNSHIENYTEIIRSDGAKGKKLDFLTQEAGREVNTIGSKCNDLYITKRVLELKNVVETIREQIQNVE